MLSISLFLWPWRISIKYWSGLESFHIWNKTTIFFKLITLGDHDPDVNQQTEFHNKCAKFLQTMHFLGRFFACGQTRHFCCEYNHSIVVHAYFSFRKWHRKIRVYFGANKKVMSHNQRNRRIPLRIPFHLENKMVNLYNNFPILIVQVGSFQRNMICLSEFAVRVL